MKEIVLRCGKITQVDDEDYDFLNQWLWSILKTPKDHSTNYVRRMDYSDGKRTCILMHRVIMNLTDSKQFVDHKDRDGLNNQRNNLRLATNSQNGANRSASGKSEFLGVYWCKTKNRWRACITFNKKTYKLGRSRDEITAAKLYDKKAKELHGEFANLNFPDI